MTMNPIKNLHPKIMIHTMTGEESLDITYLKRHSNQSPRVKCLKLLIPKNKIQIEITIGIGKEVVTARKVKFIKSQLHKANIIVSLTSTVMTTTNLMIVSHLLQKPKGEKSIFIRGSSNNSDSDSNDTYRYRSTLSIYSSSSTALTSK